MKDEDKTKAELIKELKTLRKKQGKSALNDFVEYKQNEEKYQSFTKDILDSSAVGMFILDSDFKVVWINHSTEKYFGLQREKVIGKDKRKLIKKNIQHIFEDPDEFIRKVFATYDNNTYVENFECHVLPEGKRKERWLEHWSQPIKSGLYTGGRIEHYYDITERKQAEEELKDSEERLKILFDYAPDAYYINDLKGKFIDGNKAAERLIGYGREELIGKSFLKLNLLSLADIPKAAKALTKSIMGKPTGPDEFVLNRKDNSKVTVEISTYPVKIKGETLVLGIARDITERKKAIKEIEELAKFPTENPNPVLRISKDGIVLYHNYASESLLEQWHYKEEKPLQDRWFQFVLDALKDDDIKTVETEIGDKVISLTFAPIVEKDFVNVYGLDITERKQAEERVKHLNLVLRAIRSVNQLIIKVKDRESLLKGACESLTKTRGYHKAWIALLDEEGKLKTSAETGLGKAFLPMIELFKKGRPTTCSQKALKQQEVVIIEDPVSICAECPLAQKYSGRGAMTTRLEYNGKVYGLMSVSIPTHFAVDQEEQDLFEEVAEDIAFGIHNIELDEERMQAEENVKKAKDELQIIMDSVPAIIVYKDIEGRIIRANKALADSLKMSIEDIVGKTTEELFPKEQAEKMRKDDKEVMISGKPKMNITEPYDTPEGTRWAITDKMPCKDKEGKVISLISLSKDITFQKRSEQKLKLTYQKLKKTMNASIDTMSKIIEVKDPYTAGHQQKVSQLATAIAKELNLSPDKVEGIRIASIIHDIGKISVPTEILSKTTTLSDIEFNLIKGHSQVGYDILKSIDFSYPVANIVLQHHERLNGSGYPNNLKSDKILPEARIIGVADVVEAMSSHRPYRPALGMDKALNEISQNRGILYDPEIVDACLKLFKEKEFKFE